MTIKKIKSNTHLKTQPYAMFF